jgi:U4/U6.U5 tri-snRNP component SNU23
LPNERTQYLKSRQHDLKIEARVGKTYEVDKDASGNKKSPFYCSVCDVDFNDSHTYVDHLNGKKRRPWVYKDNRILGTNMKVEAVSADVIKAKLDRLSNQAPKTVSLKPENKPEEANLGKRAALDDDGEEEEAYEDVEEGGDEEGEEEEEDEDTKEMARLGLPTKLR